ncbi:MAG: hypothetical protein HDR88_12350 [Bacteroides sp.]|nr:hypothetical protein [Bacteroides sp.]
MLPSDVPSEVKIQIPINDKSVGACTRYSFFLTEASRIAHHRKNEQHQKPTPYM